jgi:hypothetical protein
MLSLDHTDLSSNGGQMTGAERSLLQMIYNYFHEHAKWPRSRWVEVEFAETADFTDITRSLRPVYLRNGDPIYEGATCELTVAGLLECDGSKRDLENFLRMIPFLARAYRDDSKVHRADVMQELSLGDNESQRLFELLHTDSTLTSGGGRNPDGWDYLGASQAAFRLRKVSSIQEYLEEKRKLYLQPEASTGPEVDADPEPGSIGGPSGAPVPEIDLSLIADPDLRAIVESDRQELIACYHNGAWKAVGLLAGSCCEAMLIDLLARNPSAIPGKHAAQWKSKLGLKDFAQYARDAGLISPEGHELIQTLKRWRDLVHPWRATSSRQPSKAIARTMLTFLELVTHDLEAHRPQNSN